MAKKKCAYCDQDATHIVNVCDVHLAVLAVLDQVASRRQKK